MFWILIVWLVLAAVLACRLGRLLALSHRLGIDAPPAPAREIEDEAPRDRGP
jgi:hypothetical protein